MTQKKIAVLGPGSWGTALSQVLNDNGHEVRIWGNVPEQINEINEKHTNKRYFSDVVLDDKITGYDDLSAALSDIDAILFVVPTKVTRLVAKQVAEVLDHKVVVMHASKGLEQGTHERISTILEEEIPTDLRSEIVVVSGPSHAEETIVRDLTLITAASKNLEDAQYVQGLFSNDYFRLYTNDDVIGVETAAALKSFSSDMQMKVADNLLQLFGGYGYMSEYPISRFFVDARIQRIYGGTNEIMKEIVARGILGK